MPKYRAEPRNVDGIENPTITFNLDGGLDLSGWFISADGQVARPTEREAVAAIFRYILDSYTDRVPMEDDEDFAAVFNVGIPCWEFKIDHVSNFQRNF